MTWDLFWLLLIVLGAVGLIAWVARWWMHD